ncbi:MAG: hypothetical protein HQK83_13645 [Fibrobacteria bacterium]|nr:hypothetical protein [Fibrobacteria bacterium]
MIKNLTLGLLATLVLFLFGQCGDAGETNLAGGTGMGNPPTGNVNISIVASSPTPALLKPAALVKSTQSDSLVVRDANGTDFIIKSISVIIRKLFFQIESEDYCEQEPEHDCEYLLEGPFINDLLSGSSVPSLKGVSLPAALFHEVELNFDSLETEDSLYASFPALQGNSILMKGYFSYKGKIDRAFSIHLTVVEELEFEGKENLIIQPDSSLSWKVDLNAGNWFQNIEITNCLDNGELMLDSNGNLLLNNPKECNELNTRLKTNILNSGSIKESEEEEEEEEEEKKEEEETLELETSEH